MHKTFYAMIIVLYLGISLFMFSMYQLVHQLFGYNGYIHLIIFAVYTLVNIIILIGYTLGVRRDKQTFISN